MAQLQDFNNTHTEKNICWSLHNPYAPLIISEILWFSEYHSSDENMPFPTTHLDKESTTKCDFLSTTLMMKTCPFPLPILTKNQLPSVRVSGHIPMCHFFAQIVQYQPYFPASKVLGVRVLLYRQSTIIHKLKGLYALNQGSSPRSKAYELVWSFATDTLSSVEPTYMLLPYSMVGRGHQKKKPFCLARPHWMLARSVKKIRVFFFFLLFSGW